MTGVAHSGPTSTLHTRLDWPDVAKGMSIIGVVVLHACLVVPGGMDTPIAALNEFFAPLRMPLFFLVSGYFCGKIMGYSFKELFLRRLWFFLVPLLVWTPLELKARFLVWEKYLGSPQPPLRAYIEGTLNGTTMYWFLNCLILFSIFLWATAKLPRWAALALSFAPVVWILFPHTPVLGYHVIAYLPFFVLGSVLRPAITRYSTTCLDYKYAFGAVAVFVLGHLWLHWHYTHGTREIIVPHTGWLIDAVDINTTVQLVVRIGMLPAAILLAVVLAKIPATRAAFSFLGRHTLVIYIGHAFGVSLLFEILLFDGVKPFHPDASNFFASSNFGVLVCVACSAVSSLAFHFLAKVPVLGWAIFPPALSRTPAPKTPTPTMVASR